ncbi:MULTISPECIES: carbonic anhydrase family protein [unclassified Enterococcus]|uniref:carbonic anhydrase n=1 Tax=unclassified Enterococcus TaxID=2608891 RepID=UPI001554F7E1|nr:MULTISPECIES: carbonic anhydrase family protein [unclassified Enterococcus]MBS7577853.1 carbonic anhydrase family protein [Enterococcus sp. MMGLQ5-2]MBS7585113.1 carbonic anhydrase family protein [Enterococcus sp. MMGLQ5-1]NPD12969.1 carbonic anhydrase family protein [Enterococcus sp. MMGLQ5-1]NPD37683.1 carbonic anhydrase family protein [Enterococcus sp. MMGLQ5-2]
MKKNLFSIIMLASASLLLISCGTNKNQSENSSTKETAEHSQKAEHIDYDDQEDWEFTSGEMQSPIDITTKDTIAMSPDTGQISLDYGKDITKAENNGHSIQITDGGTAVINGRNFVLSQFHFHSESEHTINGEHYPMEAHFVNTAQDGRIAVIGVFFKAGAENKGFQEVLDDVNNEETNPITDLDDMIPANKSYYHYLGSLTTPPLNENVEWYVMKEPVEVSASQIDDFKKLYSHNNRKVQPLNKRVILEHAE